jgi:lipid II:glycine glycyltransferase (peptidoglycan interpeptide bridge formation enzyme)
MRVIECDNSWQEAWDIFVRECAVDSGMFQSWQWGEYISQQGKGVVRLVVVDDQDAIMLVAQVAIYPLKFGKKYFYIPRGPVIKNAGEIILFPQLQQSQPALQLLFTELEKLAKKHHAIFLRFDPPWEDDNSSQTILKQWHFSYSGQVQPQQTLIIDLARSEEELLQSMKPKTRYNIKVAQKNGVEIDHGVQYLDDFLSLTAKTADRNKISVHSQAHYRQLVDWLYTTSGGNLMVGKYQGEVIVANINMWHGEQFIYLHGASDSRHHNKMAPHLLQWEAMRLAMSKGFKKYDLWGVDEKKWPGVTRFKQGFAPSQELTRYIGSWDRVYHYLWYTIYSAVRKFI